MNKAFVTTELGPIIMGGINLWMDSFLTHVYPKISGNKIVLLELGDMDDFHIANALAYKDDIEYRWPEVKFVFSQPEREAYTDVLKHADEVHFLTVPYTVGSHEEYLQDYENANETSILIHSFEEDSLNYIAEYWQESLDRYNERKYTDKMQRYLMEKCDKIGWIGVNPDKRTTHHVPNNYVFRHYSPSNESNILGFGARCEIRKNPHYLEFIKSVALTNVDEYNYWKKKVDLSATELLNFDKSFIRYFYSSHLWGIFHACYAVEPFGYSIFQAADHGKIPILHKKWWNKLDYDIVADSKESFDKQYKRISMMDTKERDKKIKKLVEQLKEFDNIDKWVERLVKFYG